MHINKDDLWSVAAAAAEIWDAGRPLCRRIGIFHAEGSRLPILLRTFPDDNPAGLVRIRHYYKCF
jgi:hypothetical protein